MLLRPSSKFYRLNMLRGKAQAEEARPLDTGSNVAEIQRDDVLTVSCDHGDSKFWRIFERYREGSRNSYLHAILHVFLEGTRAIE